MSILSDYQNGSINFPTFLLRIQEQFLDGAIVVSPDQFNVIKNQNNRADDQLTRYEVKIKNLEDSVRFNAQKKHLSDTIEKCLKEELLEILDTAIECTSNQFSFGPLNIDMRARRNELDIELAKLHSVSIQVDGEYIEITSEMHSLAFAQWQKERLYNE